MASQQGQGGCPDDDQAPLPCDHPWFQPVRALLKHTTLQQHLHTRPPSSVTTLSSSHTCAQALRLLAAHSISSAPVFDGHAFTGFVDVADILALLLALVSVRDLTEENKEFRLRAAGLQLEHQQLRSLNPAQDGALIYKADVSSTLHDVLLYGFLQPNAAGALHVVHRIGVFDADDETSDDETGPAAAGSLKGISISHVVSQSDVLTFLHKHADELGDLAGATLEQLGLATKPVVCVPAEMSTIKAFATMVANKVSCVGVVSHGQGGGLAASLSSSDLCGLLPEHFASALSMPVMQYLTAKASAGWGAAQQAARLQQSPQPPQQQQQLLPQQAPLPGSAQTWGLKSGEGQRPPPLVCASPSSTLREVLALLASHRLHRVHVVDGRQRPCGIVTLTDLLRCIVGCNELLDALGPDLEEMEQEVDQMRCDGGEGECDLGMDDGSELIEGRRGMQTIGSQALLSSS